MSIFDHLRRYPKMRVAIINLNSGTTFKGVIWKQTAGFLVVRNVEMRSDRGEVMSKAVDGEVLVSLAHIDFVQVL
jgi:hypothetical protein